MLYKLGKTDKSFDSIDPMPFSGLTLEKELEDLIASNLLDVLFEDSKLMPIYQERVWQPEADIYALNEHGDLVIFELKRDHAYAGAVHQALRYCEKAARHNYTKLEDMFSTYRAGVQVNLQQEHQDNFELEHPLDHASFNRQQHLIIVGSAADSELIHNIDYWKSQGLSIDFAPYRVYEIAGEFFFEFFSPPYDQHSNPADTKGVIFDTNLSRDENAIWYMCEGSRVSAFGGIKSIVHSLSKRDKVFLYHKGYGIVAAGEVSSDVKEDVKNDALYCDLKWLTTVPNRDEPLKALAAWEIKRVMGFGFFWARTMKAPYLDKEQSNKLLDAVVASVGAAT